MEEAFLDEEIPRPRKTSPEPDFDHTIQVQSFYGFPRCLCEYWLIKQLSDVTPDTESVAKHARICTVSAPLP